MTACCKCGHDPEAKVTASWSFVIERDPPSMNERIHNEGSARFAYARERKIWADWFRVARVTNRIPPADARRRVTLTRLFSGRQQSRDRDNLVGGQKVVVDAMVLTSLLADDADRWAQIHYAQERGEHRGLHVLLEELADG
jgi:hypothetical protein